jgi:hypothetical protein
MQFNDIRKFRRAMKVKPTQAQFWNHIGLTQSAGSRYENGRTIPDNTRMLLQLAYAPAKEARSAFNKLRGGR